MYLCSYFGDVTFLPRWKSLKYHCYHCVLLVEIMKHSLVTIIEEVPLLMSLHPMTRVRIPMARGRDFFRSVILWIFRVHCFLRKNNKLLEWFATAGVITSGLCIVLAKWYNLEVSWYNDINYEGKWYIKFMIYLFCHPLKLWQSQLL